MLTHEIIRKLGMPNNRETMSKLVEDSYDCEMNRRKIMNYINHEKRRNTVNQSNTSEECNMSYLSTKSNDTPIRPRLAVTHTVNNQLSYPDPDLLMRFVDPVKYVQFKFIFESYFEKLIEDKCLRLFEFIQRKIDKIRAKNVSKIKNNDRDIFFEIHQLDVPRMSKRSLLCNLNIFNCFVKKKPIKQITTFINFDAFKRDFDSFLNSLFEYTTKFELRSLLVEDISILAYELYLSKLSNMYRNGFENNLKDVVDNFYLYFNIEQIIAKQKAEINKQKIKLEDLDEKKESLYCIICYDNRRSVIFYPCKHLLCCNDCIIKECPTCNVIIEKKLIIFN
jgi:hypothetical protein